MPNPWIGAVNELLEGGEARILESAATVLLVDDQPLRRASYASAFEPWAAEHGLAMRAEGLATYALSDHTALLIVSGGSTSIAELKVRASLRNIDTHRVPLVIISDRDETQQVTEAIALGARGFLPTNLSLELTLKTLTFILRGGDFFPPSALSSASEGVTRTFWRETP